MDRKIVYPGQIPLETDVLSAYQNAMVAVAKLSAAMFGTAGVVNGLTVTAQSPAAMAVNVAPGEIYMLAPLEATAYSSLPANTTYNVVKQGVALATQSLSLSAPGTSGQSINYLIEATFQETDSAQTVLPYYNSANPAVAWSGPNNSGQAQNTVRAGQVVVQAKAGVAATTGSQITPSPDSGYVGLYVVTVTYGASTITSANISRYQNAPILPTDLLHTLQNNGASYGVDSGTVNAYSVNLVPAVSAPTDGMVVSFQVANSNTGAATLSLNGGTAYPIIGQAHAALQGGELTANGKAQVMWHVSLASWVLLDATAGTVQVGNAIKSQQAAAFGQLTSVVGSVRNLKMYLTGASASASLTADEIVVETALGGLKYQLSNFNKIINLAVNGAGGMDTGSAPASGYVAIYAIYNPSTGASALLAYNATSVVAGNVYPGAYMPSGFTASALVSVWPTNSSGLMIPGIQNDRSILISRITALTTTTAQASLTSLSIASIVPPNARSVSGDWQVVASGSYSVASSAIASAYGLGAIFSAAGVLSSQGQYNLQLSTPQTIMYLGTVSGGTPTIYVYINGYTF